MRMRLRGGTRAPVFICLNQLQPRVLTTRRAKWSHTHAFLIYLLGDAGRSAFQRTMCQHMQRADMESYRNRMNQREAEEVIKEEREQGGGGWGGELQCYFSPLPLQPYHSLMLWDNSWTPKPCYIPITVSSHISSAKLFFLSLYFTPLYFWVFICTFISHWIPPPVSSTSFELLYYLSLSS